MKELYVVNCCRTAVGSFGGSLKNIAIGCAACGLTGKDGEILGKIAPYAFAFAVVMALIVYAGSLVL